MCRRINIFLPVLMAFYFIASMVLSRFLNSTGIVLPYWLLLIMGEILMVIPSIGYVLVMKINVKKSMPYRLLKVKDALLALVTGYALIPFVLFINIITMLFSTNHLSDVQGNIVQYPFVIQLFFIAVIPALVEEFVFRGLFYHSYRKNGILGAALTSGLVFGFMHLNFNQFCYAFCIGVIFAIMVEATGSMFASIIAHFAVNSYSVIMLALLRKFNPEMAQAANSVSAEGMQIPLTAIIPVLIIWGVIAVGFLMIVYLLIKKMAVNNGRYEYLKNELKRGASAKNGEKFISLPSIVTMAFCILYMIYVG